MIKTILASNGRNKQRFPVIEVRNRLFEVTLPVGFVPHPRAGIPGRWVLVKGNWTGETVWRNG